MDERYHEHKIDMIASTSLSMNNAKTRQTFQTVSKRARELLERQEASELDFKETIDSLTIDHIVAIANTEGGGTVLVGVREGESREGLQAPEIVGCPVTDSARLALISRALSAHPPILMEVYAENCSRKGFLRVEIPHSELRPHCTPKGRYLIRKGPRDFPLYPPELLAIFLDAQGDAFVSRFQAAAHKLESDMEGTRLTLEAVGCKMLDMLDALETQVGRQIDSVYAMAEDGANMAEETYGNTEFLTQIVAEVDAKIDNFGRASGVQGRVIDAIAKKLDLPTMEQMLAREELSNVFVKNLIRKPNSRLSTSLRVVRSLEQSPGAIALGHLSQPEIKELWEECKLSAMRWREVLGLGDRSRSRS